MLNKRRGTYFPPEADHPMAEKITKLIIKNSSTCCFLK